MKDTIKTFGIITLMVVIGFTMIACGGGGKLSGAYKLDAGDMTYTFTGNNPYANLPLAKTLPVVWAGENALIKSSGQMSVGSHHA